MFTTRPELAGTFGMVASTHWLASQAGMAVLEKGGNAFDAAAAAGFVCQVVEPHLNGPAGEVPVLGWEARSEQPFVVCGQGPAPQAATVEHFRDLGLDLVPGTGLLPACVPGAFDGWLTLLQRYGSMRMGDVLDYAIGYADAGFPLVARVSETIGTVGGAAVAGVGFGLALWHRARTRPGLTATRPQQASGVVEQGAGGVRLPAVDAAARASRPRSEPRHAPRHCRRH